MVECRFALFDTAIGPCAIAWSKAGVAGVQLPEADREKTRRRMQRGIGTADESRPPPSVQQAIAGIVALLDGQPIDLSPVVLDLGASRRSIVASTSARG
jgi:methylated-DNA-[protein]-cysteine S-methyltransferase